MIELQDGTVRVSASVGAKRNEGNYQSQDAHFGISVEVPIPDGLETEEVLAGAQDLFAIIKASVNASVAAELGFDVGDDGELIVTAPDDDAPKAKPARKTARKTARKAAPKQRQRRGGDNTATVADVNGEAYYDQRPKKLSGEHKPTAADFRSVEGRRSVWVIDKDGSVKEDVVDQFDLSDDEVNELLDLL